MLGSESDEEDEEDGDEEETERRDLVRTAGERRSG